MALGRQRRTGGAGTGRRGVGWHPGELHPRVGLDPLCGSSVTNLSRPAERVVTFYNQRGKAEQHIKEGKHALKWTPVILRQVPQQRRPAPASRPGLQSRQLHADACFAKGGRALVAHDAAGKVGEDRYESGQPWPVRHISIGRGCRPKKLVPENLAPD